jgi:hypothetical protein
MTRLVKNEGRICPRIESSAASHTVASPKSGSLAGRLSSPNRAAPECSTNGLTITIPTLNQHIKQQKEYGEAVKTVERLKGERKNS